MPERFHLSIPADLYRRLETARGDVPRSLWISRAIEWRLRDDEPPKEPVARGLGGR